MDLLKVMKKPIFIAGYAHMPALCHSGYFMGWFYYQRSWGGPGAGGLFQYCRQVQCRHKNGNQSCWNRIFYPVQTVTGVSVIRCL